MSTCRLKMSYLGRSMLACLSLTLMLGYLSTAHAAWLKTGNTTAVASSGDYGRYWTLQNTVTLARANAVYVDSSGNVYATGYLDSGSTGTAEVFTSKHDSAGKLLWEATYASGGHDEGVALAVDSIGNVYVAASTHNTADGDFLVIRYLADGTQDWVAIYDGGGNDEPVAIATDGSNVYITGRSDNTVNSTTDILTLRYDSLGGGRQVQSYDNGGDDWPVGLVLDAAGDVIVGGSSASGTTDTDYVVLKYASASLSSLVWVQRFDSGRQDKAVALAQDVSTDRFYVTGWSFLDGARNYQTVALDGATGNVAWTAFTKLSGANIPAAVSASAGRVFVTGSDGNGDILTIRYDDGGSTFSEAWRQVYDGGSSDEARAILADAAGNAYVLGESGIPEGRDLVTLIYDAAGAQVAALVHDAGGDETAGGYFLGSQRLSSQAISLGIDNEGRSTVHIVGSSDRRQLSTGLTEGDYTIVKYGAMRPELQVTSVSGPGQGASGNTIDISSTVANISDSSQGMLADSGGFTVGLYLADNPDPALANLFLLGVRTLVDVPSGQSDTATTTVPIPDAATLPVGTYYLAAQADITGQVMERDEGNNLRIGAAINIVNPPDLVPASITVTNPASGTAPAASDITLQYSIDNIRAIPTTGPFQVDFFLTTDTVVGNSDDILLGADTVTTTLGGNSSLGPTNVIVTIPASVPAGAYHIGILVDANNDILEASDTNNTLATTGTFTVQAISDLVVQSVAAVQPGAVVGSSMDINYTVMSADAAASSVQVGFYLSTDPTITATDIPLGAPQSLPSLAAGVPFSGTATVTVPGTTPQGVYYLGAIIDPGNAIVESNESNNAQAAVQSTSVGLPAGSPGALPDLLLSTVTGPASAARGDTISVDTTVDNILPEGATSFRVGIYLSVDSAITTSDLLLGSRIVSSLAGNTTDTATTSVTVPFVIPSPVTWTNAVGVLITGNTLTKSASAGYGNSGAVSVQTLPRSGGAVEFTVAEANTARAFGLSFSDTDQNATSINYAVLLKANGTFDIQCLSSCGGPTPTGLSYAGGDVFRMERTLSSPFVGDVRILQNGNLIYNTGINPFGDLLVDTALDTNGATISNVNVIVDLTPGTYYLGAIVDDTAIVSEVDEGNNARNQSGGGTVIAVQQRASGNTTVQAGAGGNSGGHGGGEWGPWMLLVSLLALWRRLCRGGYRVQPLPLRRFTRTRELRW